MSPITHPKLKRSADLGNDPRLDIFFRSRFRRTIFYFLFLAGITAFFGIVSYASIAAEIRKDVTAEIGRPAVQERLIGRLTDSLKQTIIADADAALIIFGFLSFYLAGWGLHAIRKSLDDQVLFSSQASHELRTPLTIIKTENELALRDSGASIEELKSVLRSTVDDVGRMTAIVADLLMLSRGADAKSQAARPLDLSDAATKICKRMRPLAYAKGIAFAYDAGPDAFATIDEAVMEKVQTNLIQNAINYTPPGGKVAVSVARRDSRLALIVSDTGVGISSEDLPHLFEPFYKGRHDGNGYTQGSGLGLAIVKKAVGDFGGKILVESQVGKGTTVTVLFKEYQPG